MIFWYSGTGNSRHAAERLSSLLDDNDLGFIPSLMRGPLPDAVYSASTSRLGFVFPVYSWGVPPIVLSFIDTLDADRLKGKFIWAVCTCGDEAGMAMDMLRRKLSSKGLELNAAFSVIMPNDYVLLPGFDVDSPKVRDAKLASVGNRLESIAGFLNRGDNMTDVYLGSWPRTKTSLIYPIFRRWGIFPDRWKSNDRCVGCGKCEDVCPSRNITLDDSNHPEWGKDCLSCCACYHICPVNAVQYGSATKGKGQYFFKKKIR